MKYITDKIFFIFVVALVLGCQNKEETVSNSASTITLKELSQKFKSPSIDYRPETWFHLIGNNISKEGLTADLEAIKTAGLQGIHLFNKSGRPYPNVEQIKILSPQWEDMIRHAADECKRLGLKFTMQNCPGWSMAGGPWVPVEEAQREVVETVYRVDGNTTFNNILKIDSLYYTEDYDYKDIKLLAFPTPKGDDNKAFNPDMLETNNNSVPWKAIFNPNSKIIIKERSTTLNQPVGDYRDNGISKVNGQNTWVKAKFNAPVTLRSINFPPIRHMLLNKQYPRVNTSIKVQAIKNNILEDIITVKIPDANWTDRQIYLTLAVPETKSKEFVFTFEGEHSIQPELIRLSSKPRLHNHEAKSAKAMRILEKEIDVKYASNTVISKNNIIDISNKMTDNGNLTWTAPEGDWTVVRFGHINMRRTNKPAVREATGWESSKMDKVAIENHLRNGMIGNLIKDGGPIGDGKLYGLLIDSWESYIPTWTINAEDLFKEFEERRGYNMASYLPATMGYIVESADISTKFLRDLRHTMDEVYIDNFFKHFATVAHDMGAKVYTEGAGGEVLPIDPMRYYGVSDIPMTEFWYPKAPSNQPGYAKPIYSAASAVHLYNKPVLAAEACTQLGVKWNEHPFSVKYLIDYNFTKGVNHLVFHTFSHTPQKEIYPGSTFGGHIGFPLVRHQTWWKYMPNWVDYLSRNQFILQQGEYVADVLWYIGDHLERPPYDVDYFPKGYRFDFLNSEILQENLTILDGKIHAKDAGFYKIIMLKDAKDMLLSTAKKLEELVLNGAVILGDKPIDSPSLMDDNEDLLELEEITNRLWNETPSGVKQVGKGKVYWGKTIDEVLTAEKIAKDVIVPNNLDINWIHRKTDDADIYFIASKLDKPVDVSLSFNVHGVNPQIWDAFSGNKTEAPVWNFSKGRTNVALSLPASGSTIIIFSKGNKQPKLTKVVFQDDIILNTDTNWFRIHDSDSLAKISFNNDNITVSNSGTYNFYENEIMKAKTIMVQNIALQSNWILNLDEGWDTPKELKVSSLQSLTKLSNTAAKHYSGTMSYSKTFNIDNNIKNTILDLGQVYNIAEVWCNGKKVGVKWAPPFVFDITEFINKGSNKLNVNVTNTWRNQLIYDNTRPENQKKTWTTNPPEASETELEASGLIGPVTLKIFN